MSRSYKKPWITDYSRAKSFFKNLASRRVRRISVNENIADGNSYRKYYNSYDICDYKFPYNPNPSVYSWGVVDPEPIYRYNRK